MNLGGHTHPKNSGCPSAILDSKELLLYSTGVFSSSYSLVDGKFGVFRVRCEDRGDTEWAENEKVEQ